MQVPDEHLEQLRDDGFMIFEGFLAPDELAAARDALWERYPTPEQYFKKPKNYPELAGSQFAGLHKGPWWSWALNRLAFHPDLLDLAERFLGSSDLRLYKTELWAKYAGAVDYDQRHHRDFGNHSLVAPKRADPARQMTSFILLSDVTAQDAVLRGDVGQQDEAGHVTGRVGPLGRSEERRVGKECRSRWSPHH